MRSQILRLAIFICLLVMPIAGFAQNYNLTVAVLVNSSNPTAYNTSTTNPGEYQRYAERYFENFQIPYQVIDVSQVGPPADLSSRQLIVTAHRGLFLSAAWQTAISTAVQGGSGFVNLDSDLAIGGAAHMHAIFGSTGSSAGTASTSITVPATFAPGGATPHYIAGMQIKTLEPAGDFIYSFHPNQSGIQNSATATVLLNAGGTVLARLGNDALVTVTTFGAGRAVNFGTLDYLQADRFGFMMGVDDIFWRSLVWAARKPFVLRGYPRYFALRMDHNVDTGWPARVKDMYNPAVTGNVAADGTGGPWKVSSSAYMNFLPPGDPGRAAIIQDLKAGKIEMSPHGYESVSFGDLFYGGLDTPVQSLPDSEWLANITAIQQWQQGNGGNDTIPPFSKWVLGHFYDLSTNLGWDFTNTLGFRYIGTVVKPGFTYTTDPSQAGFLTGRMAPRPYWIYQQPPKPAGVFASDESYSFFFADDITMGSRAGLPAQKMFLIGSRGLDVNMAGTPDLGWCDAAGNGVGFSETKWKWYTWRLYSSLVPVEAFTHDDAYSACDPSQPSIRQGMISNVAQFLNANGAKHIFMSGLAQYVYARTKSTLTQASFNGTNISYTFTGKAADPDGNLVPTQLMVFSGDTEGNWLTVPGFTNGLVTALAPPPAPPSVVAINPPSGPIAGGTAVTISGAGFTAGSTVTIGGTPATGVVFVNSATLTAVTPAAGQGLADVSVTTINGSGTLKAGFAYLGPPAITRVSPTAGPSFGGNLINLHGSSFTSDTQITIGGIAASNVTLIDSTRLTAIVPPNAIGTSAAVAVTNPNGANSLPSAYQYLDPVSILLEDSFNGDAPAAWTASPLGFASGWTHTGGAYDYSGIGHTQQYAGVGTWSNYTFEAKVRVPAVQDYPGGIRGRVNLTTGAGYAVWLYPGSGFLRLFRVTGWNIDSPGLTTLAAKAMTFDANYHKVSMAFRGSTIQVSWDGVVVMSVTDTTYAAGAVAFDVSNQKIEFEDALVTGSANSTPVVTSLALTPAAFTMTSAGATQQMSLIATMSDGTTQDVTSSSGTTYVSSNPSAVSVSATGLVTAIVNGLSTITASNGGISTTASATVNVAAPSITRISPTRGSTAGGGTMDIYGSSLNVSTTVTIGIQNASVVSAAADGSRMTVNIPAGSAGAANVAIVNAGGGNTLTGGFTYVAPAGILFADSFNSGTLSNWTSSPMGLAANWSVVNNAADYNGGGHTQLYAGSNAWTDYTVEAKYDVFTVNNWPGGLRGRVNTATGAGYEAWILPNARMIVLYRTAGWSIDTPGLTALGSFTVANMDPNVFHSLRLNFSGSTINVIYDGATIITATDAVLPSGAVALDVSNQHIQFEDVFVTQP